MRKLSILAGTLAAILVVSTPVFAAGDFTIAATPASAMVTTGNSMSYTVNASPQAGSAALWPLRILFLHRRLR